MSNREDTHATTIPSTAGKNLRGPVHMSEPVGAWPFLLGCLSSCARCTLDMALGTWLRMVQVVVGVLDQLKKVLSFVSAEMEHEM